MVDRNGFGTYKEPRRCWHTGLYCDYKGSCKKCPDRPNEVSKKMGLPFTAAPSGDPTAKASAGDEGVSE